MKPVNYFKMTSVGLLSTWLCLFALLSFLLMACISFLQTDNMTFYRWHFDLSNYTALIDSLYLKVFWRSFYTASIATVACLIIGYPVAYIIARAPQRYQFPLILGVIIPFWISSLVRTYSMIAILKAHGILNSALMALGIIQQPLQLLYTPTAALIGLTYDLLPFMIMPLFANLDRFNWKLLEAAQDLGASRWQQFTKVVLPLTKPGIFAGIILVFLPAMTLFYITDILGGAKTILLGNVIKDQFLSANNWPLGAAMSTSFIVLITIIVLMLTRQMSAKDKRNLL